MLRKDRVAMMQDVGLEWELKRGRASSIYGRSPVRSKSPPGAADNSVPIPDFLFRQVLCHPCWDALLCPSQPGCHGALVNCRMSLSFSRRSYLHHVSGRRKRTARPGSPTHAVWLPTPARPRTDQPNPADGGRNRRASGESGGVSPDRGGTPDPSGGGASGGMIEKLFARVVGKRVGSVGEEEPEDKDQDSRGASSEVESEAGAKRLAGTPSLVNLEERGEGSGRAVGRRDLAERMWDGGREKERERRGMGRESGERSGGCTYGGGVEGGDSSRDQVERGPRTARLRLVPAAVGRPLAPGTG
eukprot:2478113-Rhodomonas_salina.1